MNTHKEKSIIAEAILKRLSIHAMSKTEANGTLINVISDVVRLSFSQDGKVVATANIATDPMLLAQVFAQLGGAFNHQLQLAPPFLTTWDINTGKEITVSVATHPDTFTQFYREHIQQCAVLSIQSGILDRQEAQQERENNGGN